MRRLLLLFLDEPLAGRVPGGFPEDSNPGGALRSYRALVRVLLRQLSGLEDCRIRVCFAPEDAHDAIKFWILPEIIDHPELRLDPALLEFHPQGPGPHPDRLHRAFARAFEEGHAKVAAIGSHCIELSSRWIHAAFSQLNDHHHGAVGPTPGGRYHLLALRTLPPGLFGNPGWESGDLPALFHTRAAATGHSLYQLPPLADIHTAADFKKALLGPLGPALRKAMTDLAGNGC